MLVIACEMPLKLASNGFRNTSGSRLCHGVCVLGYVTLIRRDIQFYVANLRVGTKRDSNLSGVSRDGERGRHEMEIQPRGVFCDRQRSSVAATIVHIHNQHRYVYSRWTTCKVVR